MGEVRVSFSSGMFAVLDGDGRVVQTDYGKIDRLANIANVAADYGRVVDRTEDDDGKPLAIRIEVPEKRLKRLTKEIQVLSNKQAWLGHIGYVLGLHSGVYVSVDPNTKQPLTNSQGYAAVVQALYIRRGHYMNVTVGKEAEEYRRNPHFIEDYFYLRQLEGRGIEVELPEHISTEAFHQLLDDLDQMMSMPTFFLTPKGRNNLVRRYAGIVIGMMVRWGFRRDIPNLLAEATTMAMDDKLDGRIYQSLTDAVKLAEKWGDL